MNEKTLHKLEFHKILALVSKFAITEESKKQILHLTPQIELIEAQKLQEETSDALLMSIKNGKLPLFSIKPIIPVLKHIEIGTILNGKELLLIRNILKMTRQTKSYYKDAIHKGETYPNLESYFEQLTLNNQIENEISRCILSEEEIADSATPTLARIRKQKIQLGNQIRESLQQIIRSSTYQDMIQDPIITLRQDRYCIPVKIEYKNQFKGIVHDQSATGSTLFIEPMTVINIGNELRSLEVEEQTEIEKILVYLTELIVPYTDALYTNYQMIIALDNIFARSEFSLSYDCHKPKLNNKGIIDFKRARHPLLDKDKVVPIDVRLGKDFTTLLITGPNTGGKTVTLKILGLFSLMASVGLQIPVKEGSEAAIFEGVYADLGDEQSIEQSLSTFSSHMTNVISILEHMTLNSLILLDELGSGTDPIEGAALAMSILEHLRKQQIRTVATTHYSELKLYALSTENVENASCEFDLKSLKPTYRLLLGIPGKSNAFAISMKLGLPEFLIDDAKVYLEKENVKMEDILVDLEQNKRIAEIESARAKTYREESERLKEEIQKERKKLDKAKKKIIERAEIKAKALLKETEDEANRVLKEVRAAARNAQVIIDEQSLQIAKQNLNETIQKQTKRANKVTHKKKLPSLTHVTVGEEVYVLSFMQNGIVTKEPDKNGIVEVQMGIMPIKVKLSDLQHSEKISESTPELKKNKQKKSQVSYNIQKTQSISTEIDVRGLMVDEAWSIVDKYLDDAYLAGLNQVTIIHGKGTGALRVGIMDYLRRHPHVQSYRAGTFGEGEMGVTVVTIK